MTGRLKMISLKLDVDLVARVDAWAASQPIPVTRTGVIRRALEDFLAAQASTAHPVKRKRRQS